MSMKSRGEFRVTKRKLSRISETVFSLVAFIIITEAKMDKIKLTNLFKTAQMKEMSIQLYLIHHNKTVQDNMDNGVSMLGIKKDRRSDSFVFKVSLPLSNSSLYSKS